MTRLATMALVWLVAAGVGELNAQEPTPAHDLRTLPVDGRALIIGRRAAGRLTDGDRAWSDGSRTQAWRLDLAAGQGVTVDLVSADFDAFLIVEGPGLSEPLTDDDGAGACHARLTWTASEGGAFLVVVNSVGAHGAGAFTLSASEQPGPRADGPCAGPDTAALGFADWPVGDRLVAWEGEARGALTTGDSLTSDGSYAQAWGVRLLPGQSATVDLVAAEFDPFLWIAGPGLESPLADDDGGGACHARVTFTAPADGVYRLIANTLMPGRTGAFTLRVAARPPPKAEGVCAADAAWSTDMAVLPVGERRLRVGDEMRGVLTPSDTTGPDGSFIQAWGFELRAGESATIDLRSDAFDAFLWVAGPGLDTPLSDDDGAGGCDARITFTAPTDGLFRVVVNSTEGGMTGPFRLRVTREPEPVTPGDCGA